MTQPTILLVEDEASIADTIVYAFETEGFVVEWLSLGAPVVARVQRGDVNLVILDVGLPDISGFEVCKAIRQQSELPILFLTARAEEIDRVVGLEIGADDYVTKPFSPRELVARVKAILKRCAPSAQNRPESHGLFRVNPARAQISYAGRQLSLTRYEYRILLALLDQPGVVLSREQLMQRVWGRPAPSLERSIDTHIKLLRAKLKEIDPLVSPVKTHRGLGYSVTVDADAG